MSKNLFLAIATLALTTSAFAAPINDANDPAMTGATLVDFESGPSGTWVSQSFGGLTVTAQNSPYQPNASFSVANDYAGNYNTRGALHISNFGSQFQNLRFDFASTVSSFGFLFGASDSTWVLSAYDSGNNLLEARNIDAVHGSNAGDFFGLAGLAGAAYATVIQLQDGAYAGGGVDYVFIDNFAYVNGGQVPEPGTLVLLAFAGLGLLAARRRS